MTMRDSIERASRTGEVNQAAFVRASLEGNNETWADVYAVRGNIKDWTTPVSQLRPPFSMCVAWTHHAVHVVVLDRHTNEVGCFHVPIAPDHLDTRFDGEGRKDVETSAD